MNGIWPRVLVACLLIIALAWLLFFGKCSEAAAFGILGAIAGFFFGQYAEKPH